MEGSLFGDDDFEPCMPAIDLSKYNFDEVFGRLAKSDFRRRFRLNDEMKDYVTEKGLGRIGMHAADIIRKKTCTSRYTKRRKADTDEGTSRVRGTTRNRMLLPGLPVKMARH